MLQRGYALKLTPLLRLYEQKRRGERLSKEERPAPRSKASPLVTDRINRGTHLLGLLSNTKITSSHESLNDQEDFASVTNEDITGEMPRVQNTLTSKCLKGSAAGPGCLTWLPWH